MTEKAARRRQVGVSEGLSALRAQVLAEHEGETAAAAPDKRAVLTAFFAARLADR